MRITAALSVLLHSAVILIAWLGVPSLTPLVSPEQLIKVELIAEVEQSKPDPKPKPKPPAAKPAPPPPPPPPQIAKAEPQPATEPEPEAIPLPAPKPKVVEKPKPKPKPKAKPEPKPRPKQVSRPRPKSKPKPPPEKQDFASVLKTVSKLQKKSPDNPKPKAKAKEPEPEADFRKQVAEVLKRRQQPAQQLDAAISASELDAIRRQIEACWSLPAGARDAHNMTVEIRTLMNPDGRVRSASIVDTGRASGDPFYRSMAESALRAVLNPRCQPLRLPPDKYEEWRVMVLNFDPREMF